MLETILNLTSNFFLITGAFFILVAAVGCVKMSNFFVKIHACSIGESCGAPLILIGLIIKTGFTLISLKLFLLMIFIMITSSTACHSLALAALTAKGRKDV